MAAMPFKFEELLPFFGLHGTCEIFEQTPPGGAPTQIIRTDQSWCVVLKWDTCGPLNHIMCGKWCLRILLEEMGCGEFCLEEGLSKAEVPFVCGPHHYEYKFHIPAGKVGPGVYKIVSTITMLGPCGIPGPIAGFCEGEMLQFYAGGPITTP
ncbi:MAG: hypothetical protein AAB354_07565 [candidate division KSB1 bacterium]